MFSLNCNSIFFENSLMVMTLNFALHTIMKVNHENVVFVHVSTNDRFLMLENSAKYKCTIASLYIERNNFLFKSFVLYAHEILSTGSQKQFQDCYMNI